MHFRRSQEENQVICQLNPLKCSEDFSEVTLCTLATLLKVKHKLINYLDKILGFTFASCLRHAIYRYIETQNRYIICKTSMIMMTSDRTAKERSSLSCPLYPDFYSFIFWGGSLDQQTLHESTQRSQKSESPTHTRVLQAQLHLKHSYLTYAQYRQDTAATQGNEVGI